MGTTWIIKLPEIVLKRVVKYKAKVKSHSQKVMENTDQGKNSCTKTNLSLNNI